VALISVPFIFVGAGSIVRFMASFLENEYYQGYAETMYGGATTYIVLMELLSLFCFIGIRKKLILGNESISYLYINLPVLTFLVPLINLNGSMIRMGQFFTVYLMLLFPYTIDFSVTKKDRPLVYSISVTILIFYILQSSVEYEFFWNSVIL
jgi:transmembrane protein EpsG